MHIHRRVSVQAYSSRWHFFYAAPVLVIIWGGVIRLCESVGTEAYPACAVGCGSCQYLVLFASFSPALSAITYTAFEIGGKIGLKKKKKTGKKRGCEISPTMGAEA